MRLILASGSPRRHELLAHLTSEFEVMPADIDEIIDTEIPEVSQQIADMARQKAIAVANTLSEAHTEPALILGADTVVYLKGQILVKPKDTADADRMLSALSGQTHQVITGLALVHKNSTGLSVEISSVISQVTMREISSEERQAYIATGEPMDKAGAYAIQGKASDFITAIEGSYENIVGLPLEATQRLLESANYPHLK